MMRPAAPCWPSLPQVVAQLPGRAVVLQPRPRRYKFGALNYGEVVDEWYNAADGDKWDVFAPGLARELPTGVPYHVAEVLGHLRLLNGNHKIAVRLADVRGYDAAAATREIAAFEARYTRRVRVPGRFVWR
jgi:hypothetical protein